MLTWSQIGIQRKASAILNVNGYYDPLLAMADRAVAEGFLRDIHRELLLTDTEPGRLLDRIFKRVDGDEAPLIPWVGLTLLCTLATSLNPWGWELHRHVFLVATNLKSIALLVEDLPPNFATPSMSAITVLFIVIVVFMARVFRCAPLWCWPGRRRTGFVASGCTPCCRC